MRTDTELLDALERMPEHSTLTIKYNEYAAPQKEGQWQLRSKLEIPKKNSLGLQYFGGGNTVRECIEAAVNEALKRRVLGE